MVILLPHKSLSSKNSQEEKIRKRIIEEDLLNCVISLPKQLFYNTSIACSLLIFKKEKKRKKEVLFIDISNLGYMKNQNQKELHEENDIQKVINLYKNWENLYCYKNEQGLCQSTSIEEIQNHAYYLFTPNSYIIPLLEEHKEKEKIFTYETSLRWKIRFENYKKAYFSLEESILAHQKEKENKFIQDSIIQRYEYTIELAWKTMKDYLEEQGFFNITSPKNVIRKSFEEYIIKDPHGWIKALNDRNNISHAYDENIARKITQEIVESHFALFRDLCLFFKGELS